MSWLSSVTHVLASCREAADHSNSNPLAPTLSPLGRGEGVGSSVRLRPVRLAAKPENKRALCGLLRQSISHNHESARQNI
jgi:hypothetical protein